MFVVPPAGLDPVAFRERFAACVKPSDQVVAALDGVDPEGQPTLQQLPDERRC